ncbi:NAC domain-containing protein 82 [Linum grandiflorum]
MVGSTRLSPGFRFHPTDVELVKFYLKRKVMGKKLPSHCITELDIYKYAPWDLPLKSELRTGDLKWYFFTPIEKKYACGTRMKRAAERGYWKTTGKDREVHYDNEVAGTIKTLVFHQGKAPKGERTDWVMYEYRLQDKQLIDSGVSQDSYVISVIFKKNGPGPNNGAQYGAPFKEEDWESDDEEEEVNDGTGAALWAGGSAPSMVTSVERTNSAVTSPVVPDGSCVVSPVSCPPEKENAQVGPVGPDVTNANEGVAQAVHGGVEVVPSAAPLASQPVPQAEYCASGGVFQAQHVPQTVYVASEEHGEAVHADFQPVAENDDILAMLDCFTEDAPFTLAELNNTDQVVNIPNQVGGAAVGASLDGIDIYNNLGDLGNLAPFGESQGLINGCNANDSVPDYSFTGGQFLEVMDLDAPLNQGFFPQQDDGQLRGLQGTGVMQQNNNVHDDNSGCGDMVEELLNACWMHPG